MSDVNEDLMQFQQIQQQVQALSIQKQNLQLQLNEYDLALKEVEKSKEDGVYEIVGTIMIKKDKESLLASLKEKKDLLNLRISTIDNQLSKLNEKLSEIQERLAKNIK